MPDSRQGDVAADDRQRLIDFDRASRPLIAGLSLLLFVVLAVASKRHPASVVLACTVAVIVGSAAVWALRHVARRSPRPALWAAAEHVLVVAAYAVAIALTGGTSSPALPLMLVAVTLGAARFDGTLLLVVMSATALLLTGGMVAGGPVLRSSPENLIAWLGALVAGTMVVSVIRNGERGALHRARTDDLTGLLNRWSLDRHLGQLDAKRGVVWNEVSMLACDLDGFKAVNDTFGHGAGDRVLQEAAAALLSDLRIDDRVYRVGGDEFVVLLPGCTLPEAVQRAQRLRSHVNDRLRTFGVSISVGAATRSQDLRALAAEADAQLYASKRSGRDRVSYERPTVVRQQV